MTKYERQKNNYLKRKYGITLSEYRRKLRSQGSACDICKRASTSFKKSLAVDHNHKTGKVRGLLCYYCNKFRVGRATLESAKAVYEYLLRYE